MITGFFLSTVEDPVCEVCQGSTENVHSQVLIEVCHEHRFAIDIGKEVGCSGGIGGQGKRCFQ